MKVGVIAGNFDVIHPGYMRMFAECKRHCDNFVVLLHEDPSLQRPEKIKPILSLQERMEILYGIKYIDNVLPYRTEQDLYKLLKAFTVNVRFLGEDYIDKPYTGDDLGIPIHWIKRDHGWSATKFKQLIADSITVNQSYT